MSTYIPSRRGYTVIPNGTLPEGKLSARAWGLYAYLLSRPAGWVVRVKHLQTVFSEGRGAIYTALDELINVGMIEDVWIKESGKPPHTRRQLVAPENLPHMNHAENQHTENQFLEARKAVPIVTTERTTTTEENHASTTSTADAVDISDVGPARADADEPENPANDENGDDDMADDELFDVADVDPAAAQRIEARELDRQKNKRAQALTKVYTGRVKLAKFPVVMKVVRRAIDAGYADEQIEHALKDLAASHRSVTVDSLRIALDTAPEPEPAPKPCPCCTQAKEGLTSDLCAPCKDAFWRHNSSNCTHDEAMLDE